MQIGIGGKAFGTYAVDGAGEVYAQLGRPYQGRHRREGLLRLLGADAAADLARAVALRPAGAQRRRPAARRPGLYAYDLADPATIHHVGIYIGAGNMIDAPHRGAFVRITPFMRGDYFGAVRPTAHLRVLRFIRRERSA